MKCSAANRDLRCFVDLGGGQFAELVAAIIVGDTPGGGISELPIDTVTGALIVAELEHAKAHQGRMFSVSHRFVGVANDGTADMRVTVGPSDPMHVKWIVSSGGKIYLDIYEETTFTGAGTTITPRNMNRLSSNSAASTFAYAPTVNVIGTNIFANVFGSGTSPVTRAGEVVRQPTEWLFAPTKNYLIRATNKSGGAQDIGIALEFYESN